MNSILVIEDDSTLRSILEEILTSEGYHVELAENGVKGYTAALSFQPDLIISDIQMPELNGLELLESLQNNSQTETIPVILFSAYTDPSYIRKGMSTGADDYITKPFKIDDLLKTIQVRLKKRDNHAKKADIFKNIVIKKVAHELRTPLISILSYPQLLQDNIDDLSTEEIKMIAASMKQSGNKMYRSVENILVYSELLYLFENKNTVSFTSVNEYLVDNSALNRDIKNDLTDQLVQQSYKASFEKKLIKISKEHYWYVIKEVMDFSLRRADCDNSITITGTFDECFYKTIFAFSGADAIEVSTSDNNENNSLNENIIGNGLGLELVIVKLIIELYNGYININYINGTNTEIEIGFHCK